jgi:hypothetical protein
LYGPHETVLPATQVPVPLQVLAFVCVVPEHDWTAHCVLAA